MRIVLAEDELLLREGLASLLERSGFEVVGQAGDAVQLLALVRDTSRILSWLISECHRRGPGRGWRRPEKSASSIQRSASWSYRPMPKWSMPWSCWQAVGGSAIYSRAALQTLLSSSTRSSASRRVPRL